MLSPFPGMNPYLEDPELWPGVHGRLIVAMSDDKLLRIYADFLSPQLRPKYFVAIEERIYQTTGDDRLRGRRNQLKHRLYKLHSS